LLTGSLGWRFDVSFIDAFTRSDDDALAWAATRSTFRQWFPCLPAISSHRITL
jgi:hypothetical protein